MFSIRIFILSLMIAALAVYAFRDWFKAACGLILLVALLENPDMPKNIMHVQGLNPWNMLLAVTIFAWLLGRRRDGVRWDLPRFPTGLFLAYLVITVVTFLRAYIDFAGFPAQYGWSRAGFLSNDLINPLKFMVPALLVYEGARTRSRLLLSLTCVLLLSIALALLVIKTMPPSVLLDESNFMRYRHRIDRDVGLHANDMAMLLVGAFWGLVAYFFVWKDWRIRILVAGSAVVVFLAMALCHSRSGYISFAALGILFGILRWRRLLIVLPIAGVLLCIAMPSIPARLGMGLGVTDVAGEQTEDWSKISSGRVDNIWPPVLDQISASPLIGYGRRAIMRTPAHDEIVARDGGCPNHPHNAYLEVLFDAGVLGFVFIITLYGFLMKTSMALVRDRNDPLVSAIGVTATATMGTLLITGLASQSLFPTISMLSMWCACAMALRVTVLRSQANAAQAALYANRFAPATANAPRVPTTV